MAIRRFDDECREQIATNMSGRGLHIYPETSPTKCASWLPDASWLSSFGSCLRCNFSSVLTSYIIAQTEIWLG